MPRVNIVADILDPPLPVVSPNVAQAAEITAATQAATIPVPHGASAIGTQITGTWVGTLTFEATVDGATWATMVALDSSNGAVSSATGNGIFIFPCAGLHSIQLRASAWTSGIAKVAANASTGATGLISGLVAGDINIGNVDVVSVIPGTGATNLGKAEDAPHVSGDTGVPAWGVRNTTAATFAGDEGDYSPIAVDQAGAQYIAKVSQVVPGTLAGDLGKAEDAAHVSGHTGVYVLAVRDDVLAAHSDTDGDYESLHTDSSGRLHVVNSAGIAGDIAHDAADSGNPLKIGAKAIAHGSNPTAVAVSDRSDLYCNRHGILFVIGGHPNIITLEAEYTAAQTNAAIITVAGGTKIVVTEIEALVDKATTVDVGLRVGFAAATTPTTTGVVLTHPGLAAGSGVVRGSGAGILGIGADGEDLRITSEVPTSGGIRILVSYFTIES